MSTSAIAGLVCSLLSALLCAAVAFLLFVTVIGFIVLRRRGKSDVTPKEAAKVGMESVSQVFVRGSRGLEPLDDEDEDEDDDETGPVPAPSSAPQSAPVDPALARVIGPFVNKHAWFGIEFCDFSCWVFDWSALSATQRAAILRHHLAAFQERMANEGKPDSLGTTLIPMALVGHSMPPEASGFEFEPQSGCLLWSVKQSHPLWVEDSSATTMTPLPLAPGSFEFQTNDLVDAASAPSEVDYDQPVQLPAGVAGQTRSAFTDIFGQEPPAF